MAEAQCRPEEIYAAAIAQLLVDARHVAVGMQSPIPGTGALLARELSGGRTRVSMLGSRKTTFWTNGSVELFDLAGRGGIDAFLLSGGQIDGGGNINLVGVGDYPKTSVRFAGSFGSGYLYFVVPRVILFRWEHSRRTLVGKVDFISAPGTSPREIYRTGGPVALITNLCLFDFDKDRARFKLRSIHPGHSLEQVQDQTGFSFDIPENIPVTPHPSAQSLRLMRGKVAKEIAQAYPLFAKDVFGIPAAQSRPQLASDASMISRSTN